MPLYDFECTKCQHKFEVFLKMREDPGALTCPEMRRRQAPETRHRLPDQRLVQFP